MCHVCIIGRIKMKVCSLNIQNTRSCKFGNNTNQPTSSNTWTQCSILSMLPAIPLLGGNQKAGFTGRKAVGFSFLALSAALLIAGYNKGKEENKKVFNA